MTATWGSRIKMGEGPEYLCADENDAGERELRIQEGGKNFWIEVLDRREGMQVVVGLN